MIILADIGKLPEAALSADHGLDQGGRHARPFRWSTSGGSPRRRSARPCRSAAGERSLVARSPGASRSRLPPLAKEPLCRTAEAGWRDRHTAGSGQSSDDASPNTPGQSLADGTPLVTAKKLDAGQIVLFHTSADTSWSNLALSGHFVECCAASPNCRAAMAAERRVLPKRWRPSACSTPMAC